MATQILTLDPIDLSASENAELDNLALIAEIQELQAQQESLKARENELRTVLINSLDIGSHRIGEHKVSVTLPERWTKAGKEKFASLYPFNRYPDYYKAPELAVTVVNKIFGDKVSQYKNPGDPELRIS